MAQSFSGKVIWAQTKGRSSEYTDKPRTEASEGANPADTLISDLWPPELWETKFLLLPPPSPWYFVRAALENAHAHSQPFQVSPLLLHCS